MHQQQGVFQTDMLACFQGRAGIARLVPLCTFLFMGLMYREVGTSLAVATGCWTSCEMLMCIAMPLPLHLTCIIPMTMCADMSIIVTDADARAADAFTYSCLPKPFGV